MSDQQEVETGRLVYLEVAEASEAGRGEFVDSSRTTSYTHEGYLCDCRCSSHAGYS